MVLALAYNAKNFTAAFFVFLFLVVAIFLPIFYGLIPRMLVISTGLISSDTLKNVCVKNGQLA